MDVHTEQPDSKPESITLNKMPKHLQIIDSIFDIIQMGIFVATLLFTLIYIIDWKIGTTETGDVYTLTRIDLANYCVILLVITLCIYKLITFVNQQVHYKMRNKNINFKHIILILVYLLASIVFFAIFLGTIFNHYRSILENKLKLPLYLLFNDSLKNIRISAIFKEGVLIISLFILLMMLLMKTTLLILRTFKLQVKNSRKNIKLALKHLSDYEELIFVSNIIVIVFVLVFTTFMPQI